jgi:hypothetical protein
MSKFYLDILDRANKHLEQHGKRISVTEHKNGTFDVSVDNMVMFESVTEDSLQRVIMAAFFSAELYQ